MTHSISSQIKASEHRSSRFPYTSAQPHKIAHDGKVSVSDDLPGRLSPPDFCHVRLLVLYSLWTLATEREVKPKGVLLNVQDAPFKFGSVTNDGDGTLGDDDDGSSVMLFMWAKLRSPSTTIT